MCIRDSFGFSPSIKLTAINGGFGLKQKTVGVIGGLEGSVRFGLGLDGILNEASDGLVFLAVSYTHLDVYKRQI